MKANTEKHKLLIPASGVEALKKTIGLPVYQVFSPAISIRNDEIIAPSFSFKVKHHWLNVDNQWLETTNDNSYYKLTITESDDPLAIEYSKEERSLKGHVSSITFNTLEGKEIEKVEILSHEENFESEIVLYDYALVFTARNQFRFAIYVLEEISDMIQFSMKTDVIEQIISSYKVRLTIS